MTATRRPMTPAAREAARLLGALVRQGRHDRRWTQRDLAERVGVSEVTLGKVERGDPGVALGTALEAAALVGVPLFGAEASEVRASREQVEGRLALLPSSVRRRLRPVDDDF